MEENNIMDECNEGIKASEPEVAYGMAYIQSLRNNIAASLSLIDDVETLERCLELLHEDDMPCCYTDEEFVEVLKKSEAGGIASEEEVKDFFAKWGH